MEFRISFFGLAALIVADLFILQSTKAASVLNAQDFIVDPANPPPGSASLAPWKPTVDEAAEAKGALFDYLSSGPHPVSGPAAKWDEQMLPKIKAQIGKYMLQYIGVHGTWDGIGGKPDPNGDRVVIVNGLCNVSSQEREILTKQEIIVFDGGTCYFRAYYNFPQHKIVWFSLNGTA